MVGCMSGGRDLWIWMKFKEGGEGRYVEINNDKVCWET